MSNLDIQSTHLNVEKTTKSILFGKRNLPFLSPIKSNVIGSNCCNAVPVISSEYSECVGQWILKKSVLLDIW